MTPINGLTIKFLKKLILKLLTKLCRHKWSESKFKILIYENKLSRLKAIQSELQALDLSRGIQIIYVKRRHQYLGLIEDADIIYSYGVTGLLTSTHPQLVYIPVVGGSSIGANDSLTIVRSPNFASGYIADYIVAAVFSYERGLLQNASLRKNYTWDQDAYVRLVKRRLQEIKIGVLGQGRVGEEVARSFIRFGCEVLAYDDKDQNMGKEIGGVVSCDDVNTLFTTSDYLIVAVSDYGNHNLINYEEFSKMNKGLCIVNVSRGSVVNEDAMIKAVAQGKIRGAILDVFKMEPVNRFNKFKRHPNIVITPHIAGNIDLVFHDIARHFKETIMNRLNV